jgi:hypothetical protein
VLSSGTHRFRLKSSQEESSDLVSPSAAHYLRHRKGERTRGIQQQDTASLLRPSRCRHCTCAFGCSR